MPFLSHTYDLSSFNGKVYPLKPIFLPLCMSIKHTCGLWLEYEVPHPKTHVEWLGPERVNLEDTDFSYELISGVTY